MDEDGDFVAWQRARKLAAGLRVAPSNTGTSRTRKRAFTPLRVDAVWIEDTPAFEAALLSGPLGGAADRTPTSQDRRGIRGCSC